jgi:hypothetical protein
VFHMHSLLIYPVHKMTKILIFFVKCYCAVVTGILLFTRQPWLFFFDSKGKRQILQWKWVKCPVHKMSNILKCLAMAIVQLLHVFSSQDNLDYFSLIFSLIFSHFKGKRQILQWKWANYQKNDSTMRYNMLFSHPIIISITQ